MSRIEDIRRKAAVAFSARGLLLKAGIFAFAWLLLPLWLSLAVGVYFYCSPFFRPRGLLFPFLLTLGAAALLPAHLWSAAMLGAMLYLILGIKNLMFVNRAGAHQFLAFFILFLVELGFFSFFEHWNDWRIPFFSLGMALIFFFQTRELLEYHSSGDSGVVPHLFSRKGERRVELISIWIGSLLVAQLLLGILFLSLNPLYQTALLFLSTVIITDLLLEYARGAMNRKKLLADFSIFFILASFILASAEWGL